MLNRETTLRPAQDLLASRRWYWMPIVVFALGMASLLLLVGTNSIQDRFIVRDLELVHAIAQIQTQVATSHLWLEEYVSGDEVEVEQIFANLSWSLQAVEAMLEGGRFNPRHRGLEALDDPALRQLGETIRARLQEFEAISRTRRQGFEARRFEEVGIGSPLDIEYDRVFGELFQAANALEAALDERLARNQARSRVLFLTILAAWLLIVGLAVTGLWTRERRRRLAVEALRSSEAQLLQAQKMEAVGRLAGGLAHDINNYLAAITALCELVVMKAEPGDWVAKKMNSVLATVAKASDLIERLLAFSRQQPVHPEVVSLARVVHGLEPMMHRLMGDDVELETRLEEGLWQVKIDPAQLEQIIVNLLVNARDAMPTGGKVTIEVANRTLDEVYLSGHPMAQAGECVLLAVSDTGTGIAPEIRDKIFEPFFTTKPKTEGSGLGLATVYGIVNQNSGTVAVYSEVGEGTTFKIYLPRCLEAGPLGAGPAAEETARVGGSERILLVEDNDEVRESSQAVLEALGYRVVTAANGLEALELFDADGQDVDLLITDVVMPGMSGKEVMEELRGCKEDLKVIFMSGYTDNVVLRHGILDGDFDFLQKPFSSTTLAGKIREVLERPEHQAH